MLPVLKAKVSAHGVARLLIVSYFVALSLDWIDGAQISALLTPFLDEFHARHITRVVMLLLCGMVLFDLWRRAGALLLSVILFGASYVSMYTGADIGAFWRDLALIGGLLLTADIAGAATAETDDKLAPEPDDDENVLSGPTLRSRVVSRNAYRKDFDLVRSN